MCEVFAPLRPAREEQRAFGGDLSDLGEGKGRGLIAEVVFYTTNSAKSFAIKSGLGFHSFACLGVLTPDNTQRGVRSQGLSACDIGFEFIANDQHIVLGQPHALAWQFQHQWRRLTDHNCFYICRGLERGQDGTCAGD